MRAAAALLLLLTAAAALLFAVVQADDHDDGPAYRAGGSIVSRAHANGRVEFCFEAVDGQRLCPTARFLNPDTARRGRWLRSSEIQWRAAVDPDRIVQPAAQAAAATGTSCQTDLERMMAATWKVEAALASGTAFHIGAGRFLTAHHVIDGQPPFVALLHGDQVLPAMVLGSDPAVDMALLEVVRPDSASDIPVVAMRNPVAADVGSPVHLVGYPQGGPLTVSYGGVVSRVWEDEILTTASAAGGNSGGPMFDACGEVLGVLWAGSPDSNFSHSSAAVQAAIARMTPRRPPLPSRLPSFLQGDDWLVWHYGPEPPPMVNCSGHDGDRWIGVIEERIGDIQYALSSVAESVSTCSWRHVAAVGWTGDISSNLGSDGAICIPRIAMSDPEEAIAAELGAWDRPVGRFRLRSVTQPIHCPGPSNYSLLFDVADPIDADIGMEAMLVAADGRTLPAVPNSWTGTSPGTSPQYRSISLDWDAPPGFAPAAVQVRITHPRSAPHRLAETLQLDAAARAGLAWFGGRIDILVNVAGGTGPLETAAWDTEPEAFDRIVELNMKGCYLTMRAVLPAMIARRYGKIVNVGGTFGLRGRAGRMAYSASKWGLRGITKSTALEVGVHNVNVNCVCPGMVDGPRFRRVCAERAKALGVTPEEARALHAEEYALKRVSTDVDVANAVLFLASDRARNITGQDLAVDGGWVI